MELNYFRCGWQTLVTLDPLLGFRKWKSRVRRLS